MGFVFSGDPAHAFDVETFFPRPKKFICLPSLPPPWPLQDSGKRAKGPFSPRRGVIPAFASKRESGQTVGPHLQGRRLSSKQAGEATTRRAANNRSGGGGRYCSRICIFEINHIVFWERFFLHDFSFKIAQLN